MVKSRLEKRFDTANRKQNVMHATLHGREYMEKSGKNWKKRDDILKSHRRQFVVNAQDKELLEQKSAKVTMRNIKKIEAKRARKLRKELPMILQRGMNVHNENNYAFVNNILSNL